VGILWALAVPTTEFLILGAYEMTALQAMMTTPVHAGAVIVIHLLDVGIRKHERHLKDA
jgi:hypothetical protein